MSLDCYPSTYDVSLLDEDPVLSCLVKARSEVEAHHGCRHYVDYYEDHVVEVCAIGAVAVADGHLEWEYRTRVLEDWLSATAVEAMALLDAATLERHPEAGDEDKWEEQWHGPLEWVNEQWDDYTRDERTPERMEHIKAEILAIYDETIQRRVAEYDVPVFHDERELVGV